MASQGRTRRPINGKSFNPDGEIEAASSLRSCALLDDNGCLFRNRAIGARARSIEFFTVPNDTAANPVLRAQVPYPATDIAFSSSQ